MCGFQDHCTVGIATTDFGRDCNHSNQLPTGDKSKQFITSAVADDSMVSPAVCVAYVCVCVCVNVNLSADSAVIQIWFEIITFSVKLLINTHV